MTPLDQQRIEDRKDGLLPCCLVHKIDENEDQSKSKSFSKKILKWSAHLIKSKIFKVRLQGHICFFWPPFVGCTGLAHI